MGGVGYEPAEAPPQKMQGFFGIIELPSVAKAVLLSFVQFTMGTLNLAAFVVGWRDYQKDVAKYGGSALLLA